MFVFYVYFPIRHNNALFLMSAAVHCNKLKVRTEYKDFIRYRPKLYFAKSMYHILRWQVGLELDATVVLDVLFS